MGSALYLTLDFLIPWQNSEICQRIPHTGCGTGRKKRSSIGKHERVGLACHVSWAPGNDMVTSSHAVPFPAVSLRAQEAIKWLAKSGSSRYKTCMLSLNDPSLSQSGAPVSPGLPWSRARHDHSEGRRTTSSSPCGRYRPAGEVLRTRSTQDPSKIRSSLQTSVPGRWNARPPRN